MLKTAAAKIAWVGKTASMVFGLALVMALSSCSSGSQETKNPTNFTPSIAFMKEDSDGFWQTWVANKDLSDQVKLTSGSTDSGWAVCKPGGAKLAFDSGRADPDPDDPNAINDIFKMNPHGSGIVKLTDSEDFSGDPGWSPDGSKIAYASDRRNGAERGEIYVMGADGTNVRRVSTLPEKAGYDSAPRFSPDGRRLVFTRYISDPNPAALFTVGVDGSGLKQLTPWDNGAGDAHWSPDGTKIVFEAYPSFDSHGEIFTIGADGEQLTNLTNNFRSGDHDYWCEYARRWIWIKSGWDLTVNPAEKASLRQMLAKCTAG